MPRKKRIFMIISLISIATLGVGGIFFRQLYSQGSKEDIMTSTQISGNNTAIKIEPTQQITKLEDGLSAVRFDDAYHFDDFLSQGGASTDLELVEFLSNQIFSGQISLNYSSDFFGCSTLSAVGKQGYLFGRNFDWDTCNAMIVVSDAEEAYASISTVNMDFITGNGIDLSLLPGKVKTIAALYAPLDGMNEKGLAISVNMIQDTATINQSTEKPDITTTTAIRLILNKAATVEEAIELLAQYDMHASMNMMIHFAIADITGRSVVVEYIDNQMIVTDTAVVTNFYLSEGGKFGIGTSQSHERYDILIETVESTSQFTVEEVMNALNRVSKDNFGEFESTEWSIVFNQSTGETEYVHRENYNERYIFTIK